MDNNTANPTRVEQIWTNMRTKSEIRLVYLVHLRTGQHMISVLSAERFSPLAVVTDYSAGTRVYNTVELARASWGRRVNILKDGGFVLTATKQG